MRWIGFVVVVSLLGCDGGGAEDGPDAGGRGADGSAVAELPCAVADVISRNCLGCHSDPPILGAPMPLTSYEATQAPARSDASRRVWEMMQIRVHSTEDPMPPSSAGTLSAEDLAVLDAWFADSTPRAAGAERCGGERVDGGTADAGGILGGVGPEHLPCTPTHELTAHAAGSDAPFPVPADAGNLYQCFAFRSPFVAGAQATAWAPVIDDTRVVHHWILYRTAAPQTDGAVSGCAMPSDAEFLMGWAPGGRNAVLPGHVGLELPGPDQWLILQLHYNNGAGFADAEDASGVALCATDTPRENEAGILWLGSTAISIPAGAIDHTVTGSCPSTVTRLMPGPLHILGSGPHMHELGTRFVTELLPGGDAAAARTVVQVDHWDFHSQRFYWHDEEIVVQPGDALRTRCTWDNPGPSTVRFGERTEDEMCFDFVMVYPTTSFVGGQRRCLL